MFSGRGGRLRARIVGAGAALAMGTGLLTATVPGAAPAAAADQRPAHTTHPTQRQALAKAADSGDPVEVVDMRTENSETYAEPDGSLEEHDHLQQQRTRVDGRWQAIDTTLTKTGDGYAPKVGGVDVAFSAGGAGPLVTLRQGRQKLQLSWPGDLPEPTVAGDTATYPNVLKDVDLRMRATREGYTQLLVVKNAEAAADPALKTLRLKTAATGLKLRQTDDNALEAVDTAGEGVVFAAPSPLMWDSTQPPSDGDGGTDPSPSPSAAGRSTPPAPATTAADGGSEPGPGDGGKVADVGVRVDDGGTAMVLTPDEKLLNGADTTYPVYIDPQSYTPKASNWTMVSRYYSSKGFWHFSGKSDAGMGLCRYDSRCNPDDVKRLFFQVGTSRFTGKSILKAEFVAHETHSYSCTASPVELWRTKGISHKTSWNSQKKSGFWIDKLATRNVAYGNTAHGCKANDVEFNAIDAVRYAASHGSPHTTFGLRATHETSANSWKRFADDAWLRVRYNQAPPQVKMGQLTQDFGGMCPKPGADERIRRIPTLRANHITDPDKDRVWVQFAAAWKGGKWSPGKVGPKKSGSDFSIKMPSSIPQNTQINWSVRVTDGTAWSPWSWAGSPTSCYFTYDTKAPAEPSIASGDYPASDSEDPDDPWYPGAGRYGTFTLSSTDQDVNQYWYGINGNPISGNKVTTAKGAAKAIKMAPAKPGINFVTARAVDKAGNHSGTTTYTFRVGSGEPERAAWQMDDDPGAAEATGAGAERTATLHGGTTLGVPGTRDSTALHLDGTGYAATDIPVTDTSHGFTATAWVKPDELWSKDHTQIFVAQPGNHAPGFELYYSKTFGYSFNQYAADTPGQNHLTRVSTKDSGRDWDLPQDDYFLLTGLYDGTKKELRLYIGDTLVDTKPYTTAWDARRGLMIGAGSYDGTVASHAHGSIDDVRIYDKPLTATEITHLAAHRPIGAGRPAKAIFDLDEKAGSTQLHGRPDIPDAQLKGGAELAENGVSGNRLDLDGTSGYAAAGSPQVETSRDFAVSAWAKLPKDKSSHPAIVATQTAAHKPGFELYYSPTFGWTFNQYDADTTDGKPVRAAQGSPGKARGDLWTHLIGVYDSHRDQLKLYVNGQLAATTHYSGAWYAGGPVQIGAGSYDGTVKSFFPGSVDGVQLYDRMLSDDEANALYQHTAPEVTGRWKLNESSGTPATSPDDTHHHRDLTLAGDAEILGSSRYDKPVGTGSLSLDGSGDYAATSGPPLHTDQSFTATAWAKIPEGTKPMTVLSQVGARGSAFTIRYAPQRGTDPESAADNAASADYQPARWQVEVQGADADKPHQTFIANKNFAPNTWTHLALVYDAFATRMTLYVNGQAVPTTCGDDKPEDPEAACVVDVPWNSDTLPFDATDSLQIGRSRTAGAWNGSFSGQIDDVWTFQGVASEEQIRILARKSEQPTPPGS